MRIVYAVVLLLAVVSLNCGDDAKKQPDDPSTVNTPAPPTAPSDADASAPSK